jgi:tryptophan 2,3-dioxygenase
VQKVLIELYRKHHPIAELCELLVDLDEGLQEWRYRHVKMVQRTIGAKMGSGGSSGAAYLQQTLFKPVFPDLWEIRSAL